MANYSLVINSKFRPFSYQELATPVMQMTQAHQQLEEQYAELQTKANIWDKMANEQTDEKAHSMYLAYANDLRKSAEQLSKYGLDTSSRQDMLNMRARYASEIVPIENAYRKREEQAKMQQQAMLQNPTLLFSRRASTTSLDKYLENPNLDFESYSGAMLTQQTAQAVQNMVKELTSTKVGRLDAFTKTFMQKHGLSRTDILQAFANPNSSEGARILNKITEDVINASGIRDWKDDKILNTAYNYSRQGWWSGIGQTQISTFADEGAKMAAQHAYRMAELAAANNQGGPEIKKYEDRNGISQKEVNNSKAHWDVLNPYMYKDANGKWRMNAAGRKLYSEGKDPKNTAKLGTTFSSNWGNVTVTPKGSEDYAKGIAVVKAVNALGLQGLATNKWGPNQHRTIDQVINKINNTYDATIHPEHYIKVDSGNHKDLLGAMFRAGDIYNYEWENDKKTGKRTFNKGELINLSKIDPKKIADIIAVTGKDASYYEISMLDNTKYKIPAKSLSPNFHSILDDMVGGNYTTLDWNNAIDKNLTRMVTSIGSSKPKDRELEQTW